MQKRMRKYITGIIVAILFSVFFLDFCPYAQAQVRIKDIAYFEGARDNQLIGYGLVVGLNGTGDKSQSVFTVQSIASLLGRMGIEINASSITPKNVAAVMVTATLPPFIKKGARIDVTLSSLGDASSLQGGTLLLTPLQGADSKVYAVAQGQVSVGGFEGGAGEGFGTVARIPYGALIEREVAINLVNEGTINLSLKKIDFTTCVRVAEAINVSFNSPIAEARDGATVTIQVPDVYQDTLIPFLAKIEHIAVNPDTKAKIVINERTGTIVGGKDVKITRVCVAHKNINIDIKPPEIEEEQSNEVQQISFSPAKVQEALFMEGNGKREEIMSSETTIGDVAEMLNSIGVKPVDMIAIFQAIKEAGAIQADLEII